MIAGGAAPYCPGFAGAGAGAAEAAATGASAAGAATTCAGAGGVNAGAAVAPSDTQGVKLGPDPQDDDPPPELTAVAIALACSAGRLASVVSPGPPHAASNSGNAHKKFRRMVSSPIEDGHSTMSCGSGNSCVRDSGWVAPKSILGCRRTGSFR